MGMNNPDVLRGVKEDVGRQRYHIACNRVFEASHKNELKRVSAKRGCRALSLTSHAGQGSEHMASKRARHHLASKHVLQAQLYAQAPGQTAAEW